MLHGDRQIKKRFHYRCLLRTELREVLHWLTVVGTVAKANLITLRQLYNRHHHLNIHGLLQPWRPSLTRTSPHPHDHGDQHHSHAALAIVWQASGCNTSHSHNSGCLTFPGIAGFDITNCCSVANTLHLVRYRFYIIEGGEDRKERMDQGSHSMSEIKFHDFPWPQNKISMTSRNTEWPKYQEM